MRYDALIDINKFSRLQKDLQEERINKYEDRLINSASSK